MDEAASSSKTVTQRLQTELDNLVGSLYEAFDSATKKERSLLLKLNHDEHEEYVRRGLRRLSADYHVLDSSRPWLCYWIVHSLALLGRPIDEDLYDRMVDFLRHCQDPEGGYAGGPGQMPHLATTYAATCALVTLGGERALASINREKILQFLLRMKDPCGGFRVHDDGEMDMRGSFTALAVAHLLDIMVPKLMENVGDYVHSCQTYEGGIGGEPGAEAHGGYTFCGLAAVALVNQLHVLDLPSLVNWVAFRQGKVDGGFQGRTNKLVDGCYSFWQGGCFQLLQQQMPHLWAQQTTLAASLHTSQDNAKVPDNTKSHNLTGSGSRQHHMAMGRDTVLPELHEGHRTKQDMPMTGSHFEECISSPPKSMGGVKEVYYEASWGGFEEQVDRVAMAKVEAWEEPYSTTKGMPTNSDEDEFESCDDNKSNLNTAEKLFPMTEVCFRRMPTQIKSVELVELADEDCAQPEVIGSSSNSMSSTVDADSSETTLQGPIFNSQALQAYILVCCQDVDGGLRDKPGKRCDYYHTCYCLSGLSVAQYSTAHRLAAPPPPSGVLGPYGNLVEPVHALCNVRLDRYREAHRYFRGC